MFTFLNESFAGFFVQCLITLILIMLITGAKKRKIRGIAALSLSLMILIFAVGNMIIDGTVGLKVIGLGVAVLLQVYGFLLLFLKKRHIHGEQIPRRVYNIRPNSDGIKIPHCVDKGVKLIH